MPLNRKQLWDRFQSYYTEFPALGLALDLSRMKFEKDFFSKHEKPMARAFAAMKELEAGAISNPDEKRMVGHYWLRNFPLAPNEKLSTEIEETVASIKRFATEVHQGDLQGAGGPFKNFIVIGIGGSALGPQFVADALGDPTNDELCPYFLDNTDPDGFDRVLDQIKSDLGQTLAIVISKSGGTKETRNGMLETKEAYRRAGFDFAKHAVAVTGFGSELDRTAESEGWLRRFPMWDWVGGRTSETSAVGLLPAALQGLDIDAFLAGAEACDEVTRQPSIKGNPAAQLALMWVYTKASPLPKDMVVLPYKDRLILFSKYLQQLVMESLGKEKDLAGATVHEGIAVYGNKGSTDQHAYIQQLRDGVSNFFAVFIEVLKDRKGEAFEVEPGVTSGDYLSGFYLGTREALFEKDRESITITIGDVSPFSVGVLIALFERAVGFYAFLRNINAYHQPGVEAGKKAAGAVIDLQMKAVNLLQSQGGEMTAAEIADAIGGKDHVESIFKILEHLAANPDRKIAKARGATPFAAKYSYSGSSGNS